MNATRAFSQRVKIKPLGGIHEIKAMMCLIHQMTMSHVLLPKNTKETATNLDCLVHFIKGADFTVGTEKNKFFTKNIYVFFELERQSIFFGY